MMFCISWIVHGELHEVHTPKQSDAELLVRLLPRWTRPRLWLKKRGDVALME